MVGGIYGRGKEADGRGQMVGARRQMVGGRRRKEEKRKSILAEQKAKGRVPRGLSPPYARALA